MSGWGAPQLTQADRLNRLTRDLCNTRPEILLTLTVDQMAQRHQKLARKPEDSRRIVEAKLLAAQAKARRALEERAA